jgi:hypothetical protein
VIGDRDTRRASVAVASPHSNPSSPIPTPATGESFIWDSVADGVAAAVVQPTQLRITVTDGTDVSACLVLVDVDNRPPPPSCTVMGPAGTATGDVNVDLDTASPNSTTVDVTFEFSTDAGASWSTASASVGSALPSPALGLPVGASSFLWDSRADGVGDPVPQTGILVRLSLDDGVSPIFGICTTLPFDVDNTILCGAICGDCDLNTVGPDILDALTSAQISAGLITPTFAQTACCDVDTSGTVTILDSLLMAQSATGLAVVLSCP